MLYEAFNKHPSKILKLKRMQNEKTLSTNFYYNKKKVSN